MKRGLVVLDRGELPVGELEGRVATLQRRLVEEGLAAALLYGDVFHSGDITYLSNICIYWNEALLAVPARGEPALLTKLSRRVHPWMRATSTIEDLRSGPRLGQLAGEYLEAVDAGPVGVVEEAWWPAALLEDLGPTLGGRPTRDLGPAVRQERQHPSGPELALLRRGASLAAQSVAETFEGGLTNAERSGRAELAARRGGVEDVAVYCHGSGPGADTVEVVTEYRGYWTSGARVLVSGTPAWAGAMDAAYRATVGALSGGATEEAVREQAAPFLAASGVPWCLDLLQHVDVECNGGYRLPDQRSTRFAAGSVASLRLVLDLPDGSQAAAGDTYLLGASGAERLTGEMPEGATLTVV